MRSATILVSILLAGCGSAPPPRSNVAGFAPRTPRLSGYAAEILGRFDGERARGTVAYVEQFFRVRGNEGYQASLERVRQELAGHGFDAEHLRTLELGEVQPTWTPRHARLALITHEGERELIAFARQSDRDRAALLVGSDAMAPVELEVVRIEAVRAGASAQGRLVLAEGDPRRVHREVATRGAVGVLVRNLERYHRAEDNPDVAQFGYLRPHEGELAIGFSLSENDWRALRETTEGGAIARVAVEIAVEVGSSAATAVEARIDGSDLDAGAVVFSTHVDEPGANDNASGVGALAELAGALRRGIEEGALPRPRRTLLFVWGQEIEVSAEWLEAAAIPIGAGLVMDMVGQDPEIVGAPFLIERMPDPGAVWLRAPDEHSGWGQSEVDPATLRGHFLNDWLRASIEVVRASEGGAWRARAHPYEGGSDHASFLRRGLPAVLAWHFEDSAYHTTHDRLERVSGAEMRRVAAVLGAAAIAMASDARADREEMIAAVRAAGLERLGWAREAGVAQIAGGGQRDLEQRIVREWGLWYDQALQSIAAWAGDEESVALAGEIGAARADLAAGARDAERALAAPQ